MLCIPVMARNNAEALIKMEDAAPLADILEIRLDVMETFDLKEIVKSAPRPAIVTYRSKNEGGQGKADYGTRVRYLMAAIEAGADFIDVEYSLPPGHRSRIFQDRGESKIIISTHLLYETPPQEKLRMLLKEMAATGADIVKIVTQAKDTEDNLRVLGLIPLAKKTGIKIIAFCMGRPGRISRIATIPLGGYLTFASLETGQESASGQIPAWEMKQILGAEKVLGALLRSMRI